MFRMDDYEKVKKLLQELDTAANYEKSFQIQTKLNKIRESFSEVVDPDNDRAYVPYPEITNPDFYNILLKKKEFIENAYDKVEIKSLESFDEISNEKCNANTFDLSQNQTFVRNFMSKKTPYNGILLFHGVGVGKTCTAINVVEQFLDVDSDKKVYILMPSTLLKDNFKKQIYDSSKPDDLQCVASKYASMVPNSHLISPEMIEKKINKIISSRYKFIGLLEFANEIKRMAKDLDVGDDDLETDMKLHRRIQQEFSNSIFVIDEVHNIRLNSELTNKRVPPILQLVLKHAINIKLVLMTATPMFNDPKEIVYIINLLLYNDKRPPIKIKDIFDKSGNIKSKERLSNIFKGYVSYMKGDNPFTFPFRLYPSVNDDANLLTHEDVPTLDIKGQEIDNPIDLSYIEMVKSDFTKTQKKMYKKSEDMFVVNDDNEQSFSLQLCIQLSNVVYPISKTYNQCYGETGFWGCFNKIKGKNFSVKYKDEFMNIFKIDNVGSISCKIKSILDYIKKSKGIVFIYSNWKWSGVLPLAIALEHEGYDKYNSTNILQNGDKGKSIGNYVILSGDSNLSPDNDGEIRVLKNEKNKHGRDIKIVLATSVATEGVDLKCVREVHIMEPWFHMNKLEQIIGRAVRTCSHIVLPPKERNVTIYHHVATLDGEKENIDTRLYRVSIEKQKKIGRVERIMKNVATDCVLNKPMNTISRDDIDVEFDIESSQGTKSKYQIGERSNDIKCVIKFPKTKDNSTFHTGFYSNLVTKYEKVIKDFFRANLYGTYKDVKKHTQKTIKRVNKEVLNIALHNIVDTRASFQNTKKEYGYVMYISNKYIFVKLGSNQYISLSHRQKNGSGVVDRMQINSSLLADVHDDERTHKPTIDEHTKTFCEGMKITDDKYSVISSYVVDFVVDRLSKSDYLQMCHSSWSANAGPFVTSLERVNMTVRSGGVLKFIVCPYDGESVYYTRGDSGMRPITELEFKENKKLIDESALRLTDNDNYTAYLVTDSEGKTKFKILQEDKDSLGFVCHQTSTLKVKMLKEMIDTIDPSFLKEFKKLPDKKKMCEFYELLMRISGQLARPHVFNMMMAKKKKQKKVK